MASVAWGMVVRLAARLALRERPATPAIRRLSLASLVVLIPAVVLALAGVSNVGLVAVIGVSSLLALVTWALRWFPAPIAVSVIGVALACASLTTSLAVTTGFRLELVRSAARINGHVLLSKYGLDFFEYEAESERWLADARVVAASPFAFSMAAIVGPVPPPGRGGALPDAPEHEGVEARQAVVVGKGLDPVRVRSFVGLSEVLARGDLAALRPGDTAHVPGIVLGEGLARRLGVEVGEHVRVVVPSEIADDGASIGQVPPRFATFELLDVMRTGTSEIDGKFALMHLTAAQAVFFREGRVTGIEFLLRDPDLADAVAADMQATLGYPYRVSTWRDSNAAFLLGLEQIRVTLALVLGLMMLVAASSLVASLLLVVRRKRHDIAVVQALGGDGALVFWTFEGIGAIVGAVGSGMGLVLGLLYCVVLERYRFPLLTDVYPIDHLPVVVALFDALGPPLVAIALCGVTSGPVATLAARVGVMEAFRR